MTLLAAANLALLIGGICNAWLVAQHENRLKVIGFGVGLACQPLWFYTMIVTDNVGIAILSLWYAYTNIVGFKNHYTKSTTQTLE